MSVRVGESDNYCQAALQPDLQRRHRLLVGRIGVGIVTLLLLVSLLSGCGFHLRGNVEMPAFVSTIYVQDAHVSRITPVLQQYLKDSDVTLVQNAVSAKAVLVINSERFDRRVLSVGSGGKVQEYALLYTVQFSLLDQSRHALLDQQNIQVERDMRFDAAQVLAKSSEAAQLNQDMLQDAAQQILRRIQYVKKEDVK